MLRAEDQEGLRTAASSSRPWMPRNQPGFPENCGRKVSTEHIGIGGDAGETEGMAEDHVETPN